MSPAAQFIKITNLMLEYETGDFLMLSDLSDLIAPLKDAFLETNEPYRLIEWLLEKISAEMKKAGCPDFQRHVSDAIDLLQSYLAAEDDGQRAGLNERIAAFMLERSPKKEEAEAAIPFRDDETFQVFLADVVDRLAEAQNLVLELEGKPDSAESIQALFRVFHTIKGECGFLKLATLGELTHNIESLLDAMRNGKCSVESVHIDALLEGIDLARKIVAQLKDGNVVVFNDYPLDPFFKKLSGFSVCKKPSLGDMLVSDGKLREDEVQKILQKQKEAAFSKKFGEIAVKENYLTSQELQETLDKQRKSEGATPEKKAERQDPIIKVRASKINFLVDMIGELLIAMGQVGDETPAFAQMKKITRSLQFGAMELRTDTVQSLFGTIRRVVRDLSKQLGKAVLLETRGEDMEIDRNLIEKLEEPLVHLVRNSIDHGIGSPEERTALGKHAQGTIVLSAERRGNSIVISVSDDGRGLSRQKILSKAIERGLVRPEAAEAMSDAQVHNLIFASGFSTSETVSQVSGRGVGMDIVKTVVTNNRGRMEIDTKPGVGTTFRLIFPLSTAIIDGMITRNLDNTFIFPIASVVESLKVEPSMLSSVNGAVEVCDLRGEPILVLRMDQVFSMDRPEPPPFLIGVVVENTDKRKFMILVDEVIAKREVVIKTLGNRFKKMRGITSGTVLAGGKIGLVVDVDQLVDLSLLEAAR